MSVPHLFYGGNTELPYRISSNELIKVKVLAKHLGLSKHSINVIYCYCCYDNDSDANDAVPSAVLGTGDPELNKTMTGSQLGEVRQSRTSLNPHGPLQGDPPLPQ